MLRLAAPLGCDPRSLMALDDDSKGFSEAAQAPLQHDLPLYRLQPAAQRRGHRVTPHPAGTVPCPYFLSAATPAYALELPRAQATKLELPGQLLFLNPSAKPLTGAWLVAQTADGLWHLGQCQQLNATTVVLHTAPHGRLTLPRRQLRALHGVAAIINLSLAKFATTAKPQRGKPHDPA